MAIYLDGKKFACKKCLQGHRSGTCKHAKSELFEIKKRGRPVSQCNDCQALRKQRKLHIKCKCLNKGKENEPAKIEPTKLDEDNVPKSQLPSLEPNQPVPGKRPREEDDADEPVPKSPCRFHPAEPVLGKHSRNDDGNNKNEEEGHIRKRPHLSDQLGLVLPSESVEPILGKRERISDVNDDNCPPPKHQRTLEQPDHIESVLDMHECNANEGQSHQRQHVSESVEQVSEKHIHDNDNVTGFWDISFLESLTWVDGDIPVLTAVDDPTVLPLDEYFTTNGDASGTNALNDLYNARYYEDLMACADYIDFETTAYGLNDVVSGINDPFWGGDFLGDVIQTNALNDSDDPSAQSYFP